MARDGFVNLLRRFGRSDDGATAVEYGLIAVCIAVAIIGGVSLVGTEMSTMYGDVGSAVQDANQ